MEARTRPDAPTAIAPEAAAFFASSSFSAPMKLLITTDAPVEMPAKKRTQSEKTMLTDPVATTASSEYPLRIAVLTVPKEAAKSVTDVLIAAGIKGIWNFANMELTVEDENVVVENIHLGDSLMTLCYEVKNRAATRSEGEEEKA
jgi:hypothetical protein